MVTVKDKMTLIQSIFIDSKEKGLSITNHSELNKALLSNDGEFISIAYEAASMGIAINSIKNNNSLVIWNEFYQNYGLKHAVQIHVGLGWALSELNLDLNSYSNDFEPLLKYRVIDGFAYYDGKFKRRQAVRMQQIPENLDDLSIRAYNQGLGRSFWYIAQAEVEKLVRMINIFPEERHYDMWRGVGVAVAYVGGADSIILEELIQAASKHITAFKCGIAIATHTKEKANATSDTTQKICDVVFSLKTKDIYGKLTQLEKENTYFNWIKNIEAQL
ncbi:MAG: DUF1702 family protein [Flavobacteriales bacterium]|nr:DUF1702 family protein [Flavobacteriales bacterium]